MNHRVVVDKINMVLEKAGLETKMNDLSDIENFLSNENNINHGVYEVIEQLYSQLMEDIDV